MYKEIMYVLYIAWYCYVPVYKEHANQQPSNESYKGKHIQVHKINIKYGSFNIKIIVKNLKKFIINSSQSRQYKNSFALV